MGIKNWEQEKVANSQKRLLITRRIQAARKSRHLHAAIKAIADDWVAVRIAYGTGDGGADWLF